MANSYSNFFQSKYFKIYLSVVFISSVLLLSDKFLHPTDWTTSEWLINYQGGFVRRGFLGEILYQINNWINMPIRYLVFYFEIILIFVFLFLTYKFLYDIKLNELLIFIFFSPIFLIYPVAENEVLARKEYLFFSIYLVYLNLLISNNRIIYIFNIFALPIMNFVWDGIIFYIFFFLFSFLYKKNLNRKELILFFLSIIPYIVSLYFVINAKSNPIGFEQMCRSLNENCFGAMFALDKSLIWNINYVKTRFENIYLLRYFFVIIICFSPILLLSFYEKKKLIIENLSIYNSKFLMYLISIFLILIFMFIGFDWGRWINIGYIMSVFTLCFFIKNENINFEQNVFFKKIKTISINYPILFYLSFFIYIFSWNMKATMTDDIGSIPYYRIFTKIIKLFAG